MPTKLYASLLAATLGIVFAPSASAVPNLRLTNDAGSSMRPRVALDPSQNLVVVWQDDRYGNYEILWQKFSPLGDPLTPIVRITNTAAASVRPDVACDAAGTSHVVWQEGESVNGVGTVYLCRLDGTGTKTLTDKLIKDFSGHCAVSVPSTGVTDLFWHNFGVVDQDAYYRRYNAGGTQTCEKRFNAGTIPGLQKVPAMCSAVGGDAQLFWVDMTTGFAIHLRHGATLNSCVSGASIAYNNSGATDPTTDEGGGSIWTLFTMGGNIYKFLGAPNACKLSQGSGTSTQPTVSADATAGYAAWRDTRDGNPEIYFCRYADCPSLTGDVRLTNSAGNSDQPDIVVENGGSGNWSLVWSDDRDGNREIYLTSAAAIAAPFPPTGPAAQLECPPGATVSWTDASANETGFEVELRVNGGAWTPAATTGADATSVLVGGLTYDTSYEFRVRACNGALCSEWASTAPLPVPAQSAELTGVVRASVVERPYVETPVMQPLGNVRVELRRGGVMVVDAMTDGVDGSFTLPGPIACDDQVVAMLENARLQVWRRGPDPVQDCRPNLAEIASRSATVGYSANANIDWPASDDVQVAYLAERMAREFWEGRVQYPLAMPLYIQLGLGPGKTPGGGSAGARGTPPPLHACIEFENDVPKVADAVYHEFTHRVVIEAAGSLLGNGSATYPEAMSLDEGLADYFTASFTDDHVISHLSGGQARALRKLDQVAPAIYPTCPENLLNYFGARVFAGALWDLRKALLGQSVPVPVADIDRAVWAAMQPLTQVDFGLRTLALYRHELLDTPLGKAHTAEVQAAFDRHNISDTPATSCSAIPFVTYVGRTVQGYAQDVTISWTKVPGTLFDRVYMNVYDLLGSGLGIGTLVADSLTGTTVTISYPDTSVQLTFVVVPVDSAGDEGPSGGEVPAVLDVGSAPAPVEVERLAVWPNPAASAVVFRFAGVRESGAALEIYDVAGRRVRVLRASAGTARATAEWTWDRRDARGLALPAGVYLVRLAGERESLVRRVVLLD